MIPSNLSPKDYNAWKKRMGFNDTTAAKSLGIGFTTSYLYGKGERYDKLAMVIPLTIELAMAAVEMGIKKLSDVKKT